MNEIYTFPKKEKVMMLINILLFGFLTISIVSIFIIDILFIKQWDFPIYILFTIFTILGILSVIRFYNTYDNMKYSVKINSQGICFIKNGNLNTIKWNKIKSISESKILKRVTINNDTEQVVIQAEIIGFETIIKHIISNTNIIKDINTYKKFPINLVCTIALFLVIIVLNISLSFDLQLLIITVLASIPVINIYLKEIIKIEINDDKIYTYSFIKKSSISINEIEQVFMFSQINSVKDSYGILLHKNNGDKIKLGYFKGGIIPVYKKIYEKINS